jgi:hypothetical protein
LRYEHRCYQCPYPPFSSPTYHPDTVAPEDLLDEISIPGVPDTAEEREGYDGWSAGAVRAGIEAIATATEVDPKELLEVATDFARRDIIGEEQTVEQVEGDLQRMSRERLLPDEKTLEKVARYEAHLSRGLYKALHELEVLKARRTGGAVPWHVSVWTDWWRVKGQTFIHLRGRKIRRTAYVRRSKKLLPASNSKLEQR